MNAMPTKDQPNFDEDFEKAVTEWRSRHQLKENDAVVLLIELFRIHQRHWDELRRREMPSFEQFRTDITKLTESGRAFQKQTAALLDALQKQQPPQQPAPRIARTAAIFASLTSLLAGYLIGRAWP